MLGVVLLGGLAGQGAQLGGHEPQALGLQPADDLADEAAGDAVGLDQDQGALSHEAAAYGTTVAEPLPVGTSSTQVVPGRAARGCRPGR